MSEVKKVREGPGKDILHFWGRVRDSRGNCVEGALVMVISSSGGKDVYWGHTYSSRQGFYLISVDRGKGGPVEGDVRVMTALCLPTAPAVRSQREGLHGFYAQPGTGPPAVECQMINYHRLKVVAGNQRRVISVEAVPETVKVSFSREVITGVRVCSIRGRGYIESDGDQGEGLFSLTFCSMGEGLQEQEMVRMKTVPGERGQKALFFDSGATITDLFY